MAKLRKDNRIIEVQDEHASGYMERGYDLVNAAGEVVQYATGGRMVSLAEHNKVIAELQAAKKEIEKLKKVK